MIFFYLFFIFFIICNLTYSYKINNIVEYIFKNILVKLDYKVDENSFNELPSKLILISSHTSIYDFILGALIYYGFLHKKYDIYILMKKEFHSFTNPIFSIIDSKFKLISVDNKKVINSITGLTEKICNELRNKDNYILFIAPEGTRKCTSQIKTGYWNIAKSLNIDVAFIGIDFISKNIILEYPRKVEEDWDKEKDIFIKLCKKYIPLYPDRCYWTKDYYN